MLAVDIVLTGTTTVVFHLVKCLRHRDYHAETEHVGNLSLFIGGCEFLSDVDITDGIYNIGEVKSGFHGRHLVGGIDLDFVACSFVGERFKLHLGVEPCAILLLESCAIVVVGGSAPEVGTY